LAVTLLAAGFWGHRARVVEARNWRAGRPPRTRNSRCSQATGPHAPEFADDRDAINGGG
jgi:hypothetical protein